MTEKGSHAVEKAAVPTDAAANLWRDGLISYGYVGAPQLAMRTLSH